MSVYAFSDLHGIYSLWEQIKVFIKPEDKLYFLGDACDRGPDGWKILTEIFEHKQITYIKGNHEDMLMKAMLGDYRGCFYNGGEVTFNSWEMETSSDILWVSKIRSLPTHLSYKNKNGQIILLSHAGYDPSENITWEDDYYWDREHIHYNWDEAKFPNTFVVHGHTPFIWLYNRLSGFPLDYDFLSPTIVTYEGGHKIDIDLGTAFTGKVALLDLDSLEPIYFEDKEIANCYKDEIKQTSVKQYWGI